MFSVIEVYNFSFCENYTKHIKTFCGQNVGSLMLKQVLLIVTKCDLKVKCKMRHQICKKVDQ